jgi:hypothetical protein
MSCSTVQRVTELEKQTVEFKDAIDEYDADIKRRFKENDHFGFKGSKPNPKDWSELYGT